MPIWPFVLAAILLAAVAYLAWRWFNSSKRNNHLEEQARLVFPWTTATDDDGGVAAIGGTLDAEPRASATSVQDDVPSHAGEAPAEGTPAHDRWVAGQRKAAAEMMARSLFEDGTPAATVQGAAPVVTVQEALPLDDEEEEEWRGAAPIVNDHGPAPEPVVPVARSGDVAAPEPVHDSEPEPTEPEPTKPESTEPTEPTEPIPEAEAEPEPTPAPAKRRKSHRKRT